MLRVKSLKYSLTLVTVTLLLSSMSWFSMSWLPAPKEPTTALNNFSAARAIQIVKVLSESPRQLGSSAHERSRNFIMEQLSLLGCEVSLQKSYSSAFLRSGIFGAPIENILCLIKGKKTDSVLLMSHYDSVHLSPGAGDAASGVANILETARALNSETHENSLLLLFTDGEENSLLGATAFVKSKLHEKYHVRALLNFEARGNSGPFALFETKDFNDVTSKATRNVPHPIGNSFLDFLYQFLPNETDLSAFKDVAIPSLNFAFAKGLEHYHHSSDTVENLSLKSLQHAGNTALATTRYLLSADLSSSPTRQTLLYQDILGLKHISYPVLLIHILAGLSLLVLVLQIIKSWSKPFKVFLGFLISFVFFAGTLPFSVFAHSMMLRIWGRMPLILDFYLFFIAFALIFLCPLHFVFIKIKDKVPELQRGLIVLLSILLFLSLQYPELGILFVWSSLGLILFYLYPHKLTQIIAVSLMAIFLPQFLHSALIADSGTQFVLPAFVLSFSMLLLHLVLPTLPKTLCCRRTLITQLFLGILLLSLLSYKYLFRLQEPQRAEYFEILSEEHLFAGISKSLKIDTLFPQKLDDLKKKYLLAPLRRWHIHPSEIDVFQTGIAQNLATTDILSDFEINEKANAPTEYRLNIPIQDYECAHILLDPEEAIFDIRLNSQIPVSINPKKFKGEHIPHFIESCGLRLAPLVLEFKSPAEKPPIRELLAIFTQNIAAPEALKISPVSTIMSDFSNTLYVLKKIAL
ncbi:MAG: M28 family peptidase [Bdellovibrionota bacterium]